MSVLLSPKIRTIFFDLGNTLGYTLHSVPEMWLEIAKEQGVVAKYDDIFVAMTEADELYMPKIYEYSGRMNQFWTFHNDYVLNKLHIQDPENKIKQAINKGFLETRRWFRLFPETQFVLSSLKERGYKLGIISNNTDEMIERVKSLEIADYFDTLTYSQEAHAEKPSPAPFKLALKRIGCTPEQCVHVGDSYEQDVVGARSVGMTPILIDRKRTLPSLDCLRIESLLELLD